MARILIADGSREVRKLLRSTIEPSSHVILEAADGEQASRALQLEYPDVAIIDASLITGFHALLLQVDRLKEMTHIIVLWPEPPTSTELARGARFEFTKPFSPTMLLHAIEDLVAKAS